MQIPRMVVGVIEGLAANKPKKGFERPKENEEVVERLSKEEEEAWMQLQDSAREISDECQRLYLKMKRHNNRVESFWTDAKIEHAVICAEDQKAHSIGIRRNDQENTVFVSVKPEEKDEEGGFPGFLRQLLGGGGDGIVGPFNL